MGIRDPRLAGQAALRGIGAISTVKHREFNLQGLANAAWAFAKMNLLDEQSGEA